MYDSILNHFGKGNWDLHMIWFFRFFIWAVSIHLAKKCFVREFYIVFCSSWENVWDISMKPWGVSCYEPVLQKFWTDDITFMWEKHPIAPLYAPEYTAKAEIFNRQHSKSFIERRDDFFVCCIELLNRKMHQFCVCFFYWYSNHIRESRKRKMRT